MEKSETKIGYPDGFNPIDYFTPERADRLDRLRNRVFYLRDTQISPRLFNQWKKNGLVEFSLLIDKREWVSLSFANYLWLNVIDDLRSFGVSIEDLKKVKSVCLQNPFDSIAEVISDEEFNKMTIEILRKGGGLKENDLINLEKYLHDNNISVLKYIKDQAGLSVSLLEMAVLNILMTGSDAYLVLFLSDYLDLRRAEPARILVNKRHKRKSTTEVFFYSDEFKKMTFPVNPEILLQIPHIKLPLKTYVMEFLVDPRNEENIEFLHLLSKNEITLLKEMRKGNVSKITIYYSKDNIDRIDVTRPLVKMDQTRLVETFLKGEFADIEYTVEKGQIVKFQKTTKIKPNQT